MELTTFNIPLFRKETIANRLKKLAKKANKYGNEDITYEFGETFIHKYKDHVTGEKRQVYMVPVTVSGEAPEIAGWKLAARVELMEGENLIHAVPGVEATLNEELRRHDGHCDHCNSLRRRNDVYVLTDEEQNQMAVGRTCLRDFLGIDDPKAIVNRAQFFEELREFQEEDDFGNLSYYEVYDLRELLIVAAASIRQRGYVSVAKRAETGDETTGDFVRGVLAALPGYKIDHNDEDIRWAEKTIEYFRVAESFGSEYLDNIRVLMNEDIVRKQHVAILASSVLAAQRALATEERNKKVAKSSDFVGKIKERLKGLELTLSKIIYLGSGYYGPSFLHLMEDADGNVFSWITANKIEEAEGAKITLDASVKAHKLYKDVKQTVLTRAKVK
jgi:hypothetical protein